MEWIKKEWNNPQNKIPPLSRDVLWKIVIKSQASPFFCDHS
jgi:hypothetical protein